MKAEEKEEYVHIGAFEVFEAKRLLAVLSKAGVPLQVSTDASGLKNDLAAYLGMSGHAVKMLVAVHRDDYELAYSLMSDLGIY